MKKFPFFCAEFSELFFLLRFPSIATMSNPLLPLCWQHKERSLRNLRWMHFSSSTESIANQITVRNRRKMLKILETFLTPPIAGICGNFDAAVIALSWLRSIQIAPYLFGKISSLKGFWCWKTFFRTFYSRIFRESIISWIIYSRMSKYS